MLEHAANGGLTERFHGLLVAVGTSDLLLLALGSFDLRLESLEPTLALSDAIGDEGMLLAVGLEGEFGRADRGNVGDLSLVIDVSNSSS